MNLRFANIPKTPPHQTQIFLFQAVTLVLINAILPAMQQLRTKKLHLAFGLHMPLLMAPLEFVRVIKLLVKVNPKVLAKVRIGQVTVLVAGQVMFCQWHNMVQSLEQNLEALIVQAVSSTHSSNGATNLKSPTRLGLYGLKTVVDLDLVRVAIRVLCFLLEEH